MRSVNDTVNRLSAFRAFRDGARPDAYPHPLSDLKDFGSNPGALRARTYVPSNLPASAPLVVVLHGCTQDAAGYDRGSGWSTLADQHGFALLYPEQTRANNANLCFNWFQVQDVCRDAGEVLSIRQMIAAMVTTYALDPARVYVNGLSAGGAMTSAMLATYPEIFAGGAIIAGLPYGTAHSVVEAFDRMRAHGGPEGAGLGDLVKAASNHHGPWPTISVWHGECDATVRPANADLIVTQWRMVHDVAKQPAATEKDKEYVRHVWLDSSGRDVIEQYIIVGLGHGTPVKTSGIDACGVVGSHMLEAGVSSTRRIAQSWGLTAGCSIAMPPPTQSSRQVRSDVVHVPVDGAKVVSARRSVSSMIDAALRAAGLMR